MTSASEKWSSAASSADVKQLNTPRTIHMAEFDWLEMKFISSDDIVMLGNIYKNVRFNQHQVYNERLNEYFDFKSASSI